MNKTPENLIRGQLVYSRSGEKAKFVAKDKNSFIVRPYICAQDWEGDESEEEGNLTSWCEVFPKAPKEVLDEAIVKLNQEYNDWNKKLSALRGQVTAQEELIKAQKDKFARHEKLKNLEDFIDWKITHLVRLRRWYDGECYESVKICEFKEVLVSKDDYLRDKLKFVTLFGDTKGDLNFGVSNYNMERDYMEIVIPCKSHEEALVEAQKLANLEFGKPNVRGGFIKSARELGLAIPDSIVKLELDREEKHKISQLERARENLEKATKELLDLEVGISSTMAYPPKKISQC